MSNREKQIAAIFRSEDFLSKAKIHILPFSIPFTQIALIFDPFSERKMIFSHKFEFEFSWINEYFHKVKYHK